HKASQLSGCGSAALAFFVNRVITLAFALWRRRGDDPTSDQARTAQRSCRDVRSSPLLRQSAKANVMARLTKNARAAGPHPLS
ncbi:MAG: hypothetical protein AAF668_16595, partial [Pseudomonadota bacterium]